MMISVDSILKVYGSFDLCRGFFPCYTN